MSKWNVEYRIKTSQENHTEDRRVKMTLRDEGDEVDWSRLRDIVNDGDLEFLTIRRVPEKSPKLLIPKHLPLPQSEAKK